MNEILKKGKITLTTLSDPLILTTHFRNQGYLFYQLTDDSKKLIVEQVPSPLSDHVREFLEKNGHCTLAGNFGKVNKKSFGGKGAVKGILAHFPQLAKGMEAKLQMTHLVLLNDGADLVTARVSALDQDTVLRENLPTDMGLSPELPEGMSHITCYVNPESGLKPVNSNDLLKLAFPKRDD